MLAVIFFSVMLIGFIILPYVDRFVIALWGSIFQIYTFSIFGFYPSIALLADASLVPTVFALRRHLFQLPMRCLLGLFILQAISLIWSPDRHFGFTTILYEIPFVIIYIVAFSLAQKNLDKFMWYLKVYAVFSLLPLLFIVVFAIKPSLNLLYVKSWLAHVFNHPHAIQWYIEGYPESVWRGKPRGIIFDTNAGGGYLGICSLIFFGVGLYCRSMWLKCIAVLHWIGLFFTSVVAAMCLGIIFPIFIVAVYLYVERKTIYGLSSRTILFCLMGLFLIVLGSILFMHPGLISLLTEKFIARIILWKLALAPIIHHPVAGLGFGGLEKVYANLYPQEISKPLYRPHNTLIAIWAQSGIFAALLAVGFIISVLLSCWRAFAKASNTTHRLFVLFISSAIMWMFVHAMGENWGIVTENHTQTIIAAVYGLMMGLYYRPQMRLNRS